MMGVRPPDTRVPGVVESDQPPADGSIVALVFNAGSSSLKFGLYRVDAARSEPLLTGAAAMRDDGDRSLAMAAADGRVLASDLVRGGDPRQTVFRIDAVRRAAGLPAPHVIGHRIVHGGPGLTSHCLIDASTLRLLDAAAAFAPLHTPAALDLIDHCRALYPGLPQVACLDTAFHAGMPLLAQTLPIPREQRAAGIRRYGFHGLSCESILRQIGTDLPRRIVIAHLGSGASVTAVAGGASIDTSMGLTPNGGVVMGTRSGDLDPGLMIYLMRDGRLDADRLEDLLDRRSGMRGMSGLSSDVRLLHEAADAGADADAQLAIDVFCYSVRKSIAGMVAALGGIDLLVFTGGIGENDPRVRAAICDGLGCFGVLVDAARNASGIDRVSGDDSAVSVRVVPSREDAQIARHAFELTHREAPASSTPAA